MIMSHNRETNWFELMYFYCAMTLSMMTLDRMTLSIITLSIITVAVNTAMLGAIILCHYAKHLIL